MMGFGLTNTGLQMILDKAVTDTIAEHFPAIIYPFLEKNTSASRQLTHLIFHPGGRKIVEVVQDIFGKMGKNIDETKEVLRRYGNMSSATVLYVLEQFMDKGCPKKIRTGLCSVLGRAFRHSVFCYDGNRI